MTISNDQKKTYPSVNFRTGPDLYEKLAEHDTDINSVAKRDLQRWYDTLELYHTSWSEEEALTICACLNGVICTPGTLWNNIYLADEFETNQFNVDKEALLDKINKLSYMELWALIDSVERAWNGNGNGEYSVNLKKAIREVGLVVDHTPAK